MAVAIAASSDGGGKGVTAASTGSLASNTGSNRCIIAFTSQRSKGSSDPGPTGLTWNSENFTKIGETAAYNGSAVSAWYLIPSGSTSAVVTATWADSNHTKSGCHIVAFALTGVNGTTPVNDTDTITGSVADTRQTLNSAADNYTFCETNSFSTATSWTHTSDFAGNYSSCIYRSQSGDSGSSTIYIGCQFSSAVHLSQYTVDIAAASTGYTLSCDSGSYSVTGTAAGLDVTMPAAAGSYSLTGTDASLEYGQALDVESGSYTVTGTAANLEHGRRLDAEAGSFDVTGTDATLSKSQDYDLTCDPGSFALIGTDANLEYGRALDVDAGAFSVAGTDASLEYGRALDVESGAYSVSGTDANPEYHHVLSAESGAFDVSGTDATLVRGRTLSAEAGSVSVSGTVASLLRGLWLTAATVAFVVTGTDADLVHAVDKTLVAESGSYSVAGTDASLLMGRRIAASPPLGHTVAVGPIDALSHGVYGAAFGPTLTGMGQSFHGVNGARVGGVSFRIFKIGSPTGDVYAKLYAHDGVFGTSSVPTGAPLATSTALAASAVGAGPSFDKFSFPQPYELGSGDYVVTCEYADGASGNTVYVTVHNASQHPGNRTNKLSGSWVSHSWDTSFLLHADTPLLYARRLNAESGVVAVSGTAANLEKSTVFDAEAGAYAVTGTDATLTHVESLTLDAESGSFAVAGTAANLEWGRRLDAETTSFSLTGQDASLLYGRATDALAGSYAVSGTDASLLYGKAVDAEAGAYSVSGTDADLTRDAPLGVEAGAYTVTGTAAGLNLGTVLTAASGSVAVTGTDADLTWDLRLPADPGSFSVAGSDTSLERGYALGADPGSFAISGTAAALLYGRAVTADPGAFNVTGTDADLERSSVLSAQSGTFALTGSDATLTHAQSLTLVASPGSFSVTGTDASLEKATVFSAESGAYAVSGTDAGLYRAYPLTAESGAFAVSGQAATLQRGARVGAAPGAHVVTGTDATLAVGRTLSAASGTVVVTGTDASLLYASVATLSAEAGSFGVSGTDASLERGYAFAVDPGAYSCAGQDVGISRQFVASADSGAFSVTGTDADLVYGAITTLAAEAGAFTVAGTVAALEHGRAVDGDAGSFAVAGTAAALLRAVVLPLESGTYTATGTAAALFVSTEQQRAAPGDDPYDATLEDSVVGVGHTSGWWAPTSTRLTSSATSATITEQDVTDSTLVNLYAAPLGRPPYTSNLAAWHPPQGLVADGMDVTGWTDYSGNGRDMVAGGQFFGDYPQLATLNGGNAVSFDGSNLKMWWWSLISGTLTLFLVLRESPSAGYGSRSIAGDASSNHWDGGTGDPGAIYSTGASPHVLAGVTTLNGVVVDPQATPRPRVMSVVRTTTSGVVIFSRIGSVFGATPWIGEYAEIMVYNTALSESTATDIEAWMMDRHGL